MTYSYAPSTAIPMEPTAEAGWFGQIRDRGAAIRLLCSLAYCGMLAWIYQYEIVLHWWYMGFTGGFTAVKLGVAMVMTVVLAALLPPQKTTRGIIVTVCHYVFFVPYVIYLTASSASALLYVSFVMLAACIYVLSAVRLNLPKGRGLEERQISGIVLVLILVALAALVVFNGLANFNLDIERVYEFRRESEADLPAVFGYLYSNVSSALIPILMILMFRSKNYAVAGLIFLLGVALFGMTHHKSVLFGPLFAGIIYLAIRRMPTITWMSVFFLAIPLLALVEIFYTRATTFGEPAYFTSLIVRRVLLVPPLLDSFHVEFFGHFPKYYWSGSAFGKLAGGGSYDAGAAIVIGSFYFLDADTSANTGVIGSGYANAGLIGVAIYSLGAGAVLSLFNFYGSRSGHFVVAAGGLAIFFNILASADFTTMFLTHGLLLYLIVLNVLPDKQALPDAP